MSPLSRRQSAIWLLFSSPKAGTEFPFFSAIFQKAAKKDFLFIHIKGTEKIMEEIIYEF